jgi:transposase
MDIGSREHWVCGPALRDGRPNVRVFGTTTPELNEMADWLMEQRVESVAMESTHVYWIPVFELLESRGIEVVLVNARQLHHVPGRKTDMHDCQWLQKLHSCGLLPNSFRPCESIVSMRAIQRQRRQLVEEQSRAVHWMQKALDQMNVQVHRALTDITGKTGMLIVRAIVAGERDPVKLAQLRDKRCKNSQQQIAQYLTGNWREEHLFNLASALRVYDALQSEIDSYDRQLHDALVRLQPAQRQNEPVPAHPNPDKERAIQRRGEHQLRTELWRFAGRDLTRIDGISPDTAAIVLTEVGLDLSSFPNEDHFVSWLRLCPRQPISGGKQLRKRRNGTGSNRVAGALRIAALSLHRSKTALGAEYRRIARRIDAKTAIFATARKLAQLVFRMLRFGHDYVDIGERAFEERFRNNQLIGLRRAASSLGFTLVPELSQAPS